MYNKKSEKANLENKKGMFFLIGLVVALGSILVAFEWKSKPKAVMVLESNSFATEEVVFIPPTPAEKKELPTQKVELPSFELIDDNSDVVDSFDPVESEVTDENIFNLDDFVFTPSKNDNDKIEEIFVTAEVMPEFPGGQKSLLKYLGSNVKYPAVAQENGVEGKVYINFIVDEYGKISNVSILRGVDISLDNEALRVVQSMPNWKPGMQGGRTVKVRYTVPIKFELQ